MGIKILLAIPGHLKTVPMGHYCREAFVELGHQVTLFDFHPSAMDRLFDHLLPQDKTDPEARNRHMNRRFCKMIEAVKPDLLFTVYGMDLATSSLEYARSVGTVRACWWLNDPFQTHRYRTQALFNDYVFSNSSVSVDAHHQAGTPHAFFLPVGVSPAIHRPHPVEKQYASDLCFAGDWSPLREKFLTRLAQQFQVKIFGPWKKKLNKNSLLHPYVVDGLFTPDAMARMFSAAKVVFNLHTWFETHDHGVNPRLLEAAGCGAFQVVDWKQEIPLLFTEGEEICCFRTMDELLELTQYALSSEAMRRSVAQAAMQRVLRDHTYRVRMAQALAQMGFAGE